MLCCFALLCFALLCFARCCFAMLCVAMCCYVLLCVAMLCYAMLCYAMLHYSTLHCSIARGPAADSLRADWRLQPHTSGRAPVGRLSFVLWFSCYFNALFQNSATSSPEFQQNSPDFARIPELHRNLAGISNWSTLTMGTTTTQPSRTRAPFPRGRVAGGAGAPLRRRASL